MVKNLSANAGDAGHAGSIPALGRYSRGGNGNLLHYSCLENSMDRGAWRTTVHEVAESQTQLRTHSHTYSRLYFLGILPLWPTGRNAESEHLGDMPILPPSLISFKLWSCSKAELPGGKKRREAMCGREKNKSQVLSGALCVPGPSPGGVHGLG